MKLLGALVAGLVVGNISLTISIESAAPVAIVLVGILLGLVIILMTYPDEHKFLISIFMGGFLLRVFLAILIHLGCQMIGSELVYIRNGFFVGDSHPYSFNGWWIAQNWQRGIYPDPRTIIRHGASNTLSNYDYWNAHVYRIIGYSPVTLFVINSLAGALTIIFIYFIARRIFGKRVAVIASIFSAFWPSLVLWSTQNLKEPGIVFFVCLAMWGAVNLKYSFRFSSLLIMGLGILGLFYLQLYMCLIVITSIFLSFLFSFRNKWANISLGSISAIVCWTLFSNFQPNLAKLVSEVNLPDFFLRPRTIFEQLSYLRSVRAFGGSAFLQNVDISTGGRAILYFPVGLLYLCLSPFPWQISSYVLLVAVPEMLVWYFLLRRTVQGFIFSFRNEWKGTSVVILFSLIVAAALALIEANIGTIFRHRAPFVALCLIFASVGIVQRSQKGRLRV